MTADRYMFAEITADRNVCAEIRADWHVENNFEPERILKNGFGQLYCSRSTADLYPVGFLIDELQFFVSLT